MARILDHQANIILLGKFQPGDNIIGACNIDGIAGIISKLAAGRFRSEWDT